MMPKFVQNKYGALCYMPPILADNLDHVVQDFYDMLDEFPDPVFKWLDERLPHENAGPGTWSVEVANDQETVYRFPVHHLDTPAFKKLTDELEQIITTDYEQVCFDHAWFKRTYYAVVRYKPETHVEVTYIDYHVYWEVAN